MTHAKAAANQTLGRTFDDVAEHAESTDEPCPGDVKLWIGEEIWVIELRV
jgi:hypothetical protein